MYNFTPTYFTVFLVETAITFELLICGTSLATSGCIGVIHHKREKIMTFDLRNMIKRVIRTVMSLQLLSLS